MDNLTPDQRRKNMQSIRSKDTSLELKLRSALWKEGIRYRKNYNKLPGKPDIAITKYKIAVFCDSSFWHGGTAETIKKKSRYLLILNTGMRKLSGIYREISR